MNRTIPLFFFFFFSFFQLTYGQTVEGKVMDEFRTSIPGADVAHLNSKQHTHTNELGQFSLQGVSIGDTLEIVHIGFEAKKVIIKDSSALEIKLNESIFQLDEIVIGQSIKSLTLFSDIDIQLDPVNSSTDILQKVPGLFIGQHAGGGKAEQIFLRGFDIDHGTDVNITVDGMPVNMVSHAHGQGYADLHFVIPETIEKIDFGKGPYYADIGNFGTAGYVAFNTKSKLDKSSIKLEAGRFNTLRAVGLFDLISTDAHNAYIATEYLSSDGPFESSQNFNRLSFYGKYTYTLPNLDKLSLIASHFSSQWDASGQIPVRAVDSGLISRFGAIDDTEGGNTDRSNFALHYSKTINNHSFIKNKLFYSSYGFELFSNFTFFLNDPINGDQIRQKENRNIFGLESEWNHSSFIGNTATLVQVGIGMRNDDINDNELAHTLNRSTTLRYSQLGDVNESNYYSYVNTEFDFGSWLFSPAVRLDYFQFQYQNKLDSLYSVDSKTKLAVSPKLNLIYNYNKKIQFFFKTGIGFHSNDSRVVLEKDVESILPAAYGADLGLIWKPAPRLILNTALWYLFLEQEFVYVGDEGIVEPSGRTERNGIDLGIRYQVFDALFINADINYAFVRSIDEPDNAQFIPLAPSLSASGGLQYKKDRFSGSLKFRYLKDRPANEDNSIVAEGYFITDMSMNYSFKNLSLGITVENLFNSSWNETQFATNSRLRSEVQSTEEIHFTPGTPIFLKGNVTYQF